MKTLKVYVSMPITGFDLEERKLFAQKKKKEILARNECCEVYTPFDIEGFDTGYSWEWYMVRDLKLIDKCDILRFTKGWSQSRGCRFEMEYAKFNSKFIVYDE